MFPNLRNWLWCDQCYQNWYKQTITIVSINWTCPFIQAKHTFFYAAVSKVHVFISASDWHPEMFTEATRRQMRPQKSNACMTQASKCFCSTPHHWQCSEWQVQTQPSRPSIPVPAAAAVIQHTLTRCWRVFIPGTRCWRENCSSETPRWDDSKWEVLCQLTLQQHLASEWKYLRSNYTNSVHPVAFLTDSMTNTLLSNTDA